MEEGGNCSDPERNALIRRRMKKRVINEERMLQSAEGRTARPLTNPRNPTKKEIELHDLTHLPFRGWCKWCIAGRSPNAQHSTRSKEEISESPIPKIGFDYFYLNEEDRKAKRNPCIAMANESNGALCTLPTGSKGVQWCEWVIKLLAMEIENWGEKHNEVIFKNDGEHSIVAVTDVVVAIKEGK